MIFHLLFTLRMLTLRATCPSMGGRLGAIGRRAAAKRLGDHWMKRPVLLAGRGSGEKQERFYRH